MRATVGAAMRAEPSAVSDAERQPLPVSAGTRSGAATRLGTGSGSMAAAVVPAAASVAVLWVLQRVVAGAAGAACWRELVRLAGRAASDSFQASLADTAGSPDEEASEQGGAGAGWDCSHGSRDIVMSTRSVGCPTTSDKLPGPRLAGPRPPPSCGGGPSRCCRACCSCCASCSSSAGHSCTGSGSAGGAGAT